MEQTLRQRLEDDLKTAMKSGDQNARDTIRFTLSALKNAEIDNRGPLSADEALSLLQREAKRRTDSIDQFRAAGRADLVDREERQMEVLTMYLPAALTDGELKSLVEDVIAETGIQEPKEMGRAMPMLIQRASGRADGRRLNAALREALAEQN